LDCSGVYGIPFNNEEYALTLIEAVKSGKRFKRKEWSLWLDEFEKVTSFNLTALDIISDDWVIEDEPKDGHQPIRNNGTPLVFPYIDKIFNILNDHERRLTKMEKK